jgi:hypothetical protein
MQLPVKEDIVVVMVDIEYSYDWFRTREIRSRTFDRLPFFNVVRREYLDARHWPNL